MRRRRIIMFFAMIMSVAIIGVGFAAWIITAPTQGSVNNGEITVDTVELHGWQFETKWVNDNNKIVFGTPNTSAEGYKAPKNDWLSNVTASGETPIGVENLTVTLHVKGVEVKDAADGYEIKDTATVTFELVDTKSEKPTYSNYFTYEVGKTTLTTEELKNGVDIVITFKWATLDNTNPFIYYNNLECTEVNYKAALDYLDGLYDAVTGLSFRVTLTANQASAK